MCKSDVCPLDGDCPFCMEFVCNACFSAVLDEISNDPAHQALMKRLWESGD